MSDYVYRKFPQLIDTIHAFKAKNATFSEVCADYEEVCAWLAERDDCSADPDPEEWGTAQELKLSLEDEILKLLEEHNALIR